MTFISLGKYQSDRLLLSNGRDCFVKYNEEKEDRRIMKILSNHSFYQHV